MPSEQVSAIVVFSRQHCRACDRVKELLTRAGVTFVVRDVDDDDEAYREVMDRGWRAVPVTVVGSSVVRGFDPVALERTLRDAGLLPADSERMA